MARYIREYNPDVPPQHAQAAIAHILAEPELLTQTLGDLAKRDTEKRKGRN